jgi:hypothetical protein
MGIFGQGDSPAPKTRKASITGGVGTNKGIRILFNILGLF